MVENTAENTKKRVKGWSKLGIISLSLIVFMGCLCLILSVFLVSQYRALKIQILQSVHLELDQAVVGRPRADPNGRKTLNKCLETLIGLAKNDKLGFVGFAIVVQARDTVLADNELKDSEIEGLIDFFQEVIDKEGIIPIKELEPYTAKAQSIR
jgi:hypothetical protein